MPTYVYTARDAIGKLTGGAVDAPGEDEAVAQLQSKGLIITSISVSGAKNTAVKSSAKKKRRHLRVKLDDLILLARQLATLLESGITLLKGLDILSDQIDSITLLAAVEKIKEDIKGGKTFSAAIARHPKVFTNLWVYLIETGETAGQMPAVLNQLAAFLEARSKMQKKIVTALIYPVILGIVATGAIGIFIFRILPIFSNIFNSFNIQLPLITVIVVNVTGTIRQYFLLYFIAAVAVIVALTRYIKTPQGRSQYDYVLFNVPPFSSFVREIITQRFAQSLGMLVKAGVPILVALEITAKTIGNDVVKRALEVVSMSVRGGKSISGPLAQSGVFPEMVSQMVAVGEESGALTSILDKISAYYEERVTEALARFAALIEPIMIVIMGVVIGTLVIAMFLPIFSLSQIGQKGM